MTNTLHPNGTGAFLCEAESKKMFTHDRATRHARQMRRIKESNHAAYHCGACGYSHIGSSDSRRSRGRRRHRDTRHARTRSDRGAR